MTGIVGINYIDVYHRTGLYAQTLPFIPGGGTVFIFKRPRGKP